MESEEWSVGDGEPRGKGEDGDDVDIGGAGDYGGCGVVDCVVACLLVESSLVCGDDLWW